MTKEEAARRYLQADMAANYTSLPGEAKEAHEGTMNELERKHPGAKEHALVGSDADFDVPLVAGEREHQQHMRRREGLVHGQVLERRKQLREQGKPTRPRPRPSSRGAVRAGARAGRSWYRSRPVRQTGIPGAVSSTGSTVMEAIGIAIGLSLLYLILSRKGSNAFSALLGGVVKAIDLLIQPIDPLGGLASSTSSTSSSSSKTSPSTSSPSGEPPAPGNTPEPHSPSQRKKLNPGFGPAPGIPTGITPIGGY